MHWVVFIITALFFTSLCLVGIQKTYATQGSNSQNNKSNIEKLNNDLLKEIKAYQSASETQKATALASLTSVLQERTEVMKGLIKDNTNKFLKNSLPKGIYDKLPASVKILIEQNKSVKGKFEKIIEENIKTGYLKEKNYITDVTGKKYEIHTAKGKLNLEPGSEITINGIVYQFDIAVSDDSIIETTSPPTSGQSSLGDHKTLVIPFTFTDYTNQDLTSSQLSDIYFSETNDSLKTFYEEDSNNKFSFSGAVTPWVTVPYSKADLCGGSLSYREITAPATAAATALGYNLGDYEFVSYIIPPWSSCNSWTGVAEAGGDLSIISIQKNSIDNTVMIPLTKSTIYHEIGHNLGLGHSSTYDCGIDAISTSGNCVVSVYGDPFDVMGNGQGSSLSLSNSPNKVALNVIPSINIQDVTTSGTYTIQKLETESTGTQVLKIPKENTDDSYYIGYRQPIGIDTILPTTMTSGASIHISGHNGQFFLDTTPGTNSNSSLDFRDGALTDGASFYDLINGITITQNSHTSSSVTLQVTVDHPLCAKYNPTINISPLSQNGYSTQTLYYSVTVTNNNSPACATANFNISQSLPSGFAYATSIPSIPLASGASSTFTLPVTSLFNTVDGFYNFDVTLHDSSTNGGSASATATYVVFNSNSNENNMSNIDFLFSSSTKTAAPGQTSNYIVLITNNSLVTNNFTFTTESVPLGFTYLNYGNSSGTMSPISFDLAPGATFSVVVSMKSPLDQEAGSYNFIVKLVKTNDPSQFATAQGTYVVAQPDTTLPVVNTFTIPATSLSLTVPITTFTASDNIGVIGYKLTETNTKPLSGATGWILSAPSSYIFTTAGTKTLYAWAKDAMGNVSNSLSDGVTITLDTTAPTTPTNLTATAISQTQINLSWTASTDNVGVTGYKIYRSGTQIGTSATNSYSNTGLIAGTTYSYTVSAYDLAGNNSAQSSSASATTQPLTDTTPPVVIITSPTNGSTIGNSTPITANVTDNIGVVKVEFWVDGVKKSTDYSPSYSYTWNSRKVTAGDHIILIKAYDAMQNVGSASVTVHK